MLSVTGVSSVTGAFTVTVKVMVVSDGESDGGAWTCGGLGFVMIGIVPLSLTWLIETTFCILMIGTVPVSNASALCGTEAPTVTRAVTQANENLRMDELFTAHNSVFG